MWIKNLKLNYFRNAIHKEFNFDNKKIIISGNNGSGKTSLLEAIYLLSLGKSFRTSKDSNLINIESKEAYITGQFILQEEKSLDISIDISNRKIININNKNIKKLSQLIGTINIILFTETDIDVIERSPELRRKFIDIIFSQINKDYLSALIKYYKTLQQRNLYLKFEKNNEDLLDSFNRSLVQYGVEIIYFRIIFLKEFFLLLKKVINKFNVNFLENITFKYFTNVFNNKSFDDLDINKEIIKDYFYKKLKNNYKKEKVLKFTISGPHRDDILILKDNKYKFIEFSSTGERRLLALILKMTESVFIFQHKKDLPILLLDDILLELDHKNSNLLMDYINSSESQFFITTTNEKYYNSVRDVSLVKL